MPTKDSPILTTGQIDFSGGVDAEKTPTVVSERNPNGLSFQQLAWLINGTMRGGSLQPRDGYEIKGNINGNLPAQAVPGTPAQSVPQPPKQVQTAANQTINASAPWTLPAIGTPVTIATTNTYVGNVGDSCSISGDGFPGGGGTGLAGFFLVNAFTSNSITVTPNALFSPQGSVGSAAAYDFALISLGPPVPQPPIIIPAGPPTYVPAQPLNQGSWMYAPDSGTPYVIAVIGGHVVQVDPDFNYAPIDLSDVWGFYLPITPRCFFVQAENYLIIQAGDYNPATGQGTLPLFWNGSMLTQSNGLTGITSVGEAVPNFFTLNMTSTFTPAAVENTTQVTLSAPYGGTSQHLWDNLLIGNSATPNIGVFRVVGIAGNQITLLTLVLTTAGTYQAGAFPAVLTLPQTPTQNVIIGAGFWSIPAVGGQVAINLTSLYFGSVGDTITVQSEDGSITYGSFQVISFNNTFQLVLKVLSSTFAGTQVSQGNFLITVTAFRIFSFTEAVNSATPWTIQPVGGASYLYFPAHGSSYTGKLYDIVTVTDKTTSVLLGTFRVIPGPTPTPFLEQVYLQTMQSNFVGSTFSTGSFTLAVIAPLTNPQFMLLNAGQWTMPPVGGSVQLQLNWQGSGDSPPEGPAYPGNIGDTLTLTQNSPAMPIGQFMVTAFDTLGNITLQAVTATGGFIPIASGTVIVGPMAGTMTILQAPSTTGTLISQLPAATSMIYYQGIVFYAQGDIISGGDVVGGPSGTSANNYRDSVLAVTENPLAFGGDGFKLPISGNITGMGVPAQINAALGQGLLYIGTMNGICSLQVPATRTAWILASGANGPQLNVVQFGNGWTSDWAIVSINGDLYFPSVEPGIRSLILAERWFQQQGNVQISTNENRLLKFVDSTLLNFASGIFFNNRLLMAMYPQATIYGVVHTALIPMDMEPVSTLEEQLPANWEGQHEGFQIFQLLTATFNGKQRAFAVTLNSITPGEIDLHEIVLNQDADTDNTGTERRIEWQLETPSFTWGKEDDLKELVGCEVWLDRIKGICSLTMKYRPDSSTCWETWKSWQVCFARNSAENARNPIPYPITPFPAGYKQMMSLPAPVPKCQSVSDRPNNVGYQFQFQLTITGSCRIRGLFPKAIMRDKETYSDLINC